MVAVAAAASATAAVVVSDASIDRSIVHGWVDVVNGYYCFFCRCFRCLTMFSREHLIYAAAPRVRGKGEALLSRYWLINVAFYLMPKDPQSATRAKRYRPSLYHKSMPGT